MHRFHRHSLGGGGGAKTDLNKQNLLPKFSAMFHDRESLLASWEAIGPSQPLSNEVQGFLLAYFRHAELDGDHTVRMLAPPEQRPDQFASPPTRFLRLPRANKRAPPLGPAEAGTCTNCEETSPSMPQNEHPSPAEKSNGIDACCCGIDLIADGPRDEKNH